jgi:hypothetical protein
MSRDPGHLKTTGRRQPSFGAESQLHAALHELSQPAASAGLALELAVVLIERGDSAAAETKVRNALQHVERLQRSLIALGGTGSSSASVVSIGALVERIFGARDLGCDVPVAIDEQVLSEALGSLRRCLRVSGDDCALRADASHVVLRVSGKGAAPPALRLWLKVLGRAGCPTSCVTRAGVTRVALHLPRAAGEGAAGCGTTTSHERDRP